MWETKKWDFQENFTLASGFFKAKENLMKILLMYFYIFKFKFTLYFIEGPEGALQTGKLIGSNNSAFIVTKTDLGST